MKQIQWLTIVLIGVALTGCGEVAGSVISPIPIELELLSPNGGESWSVGSNQTITWSTTGAPGPLKLEISLDNGATFTELASDLPAGDTSFLWTVTDTPSQDCLIRIAQAQGEVFDDSNATFAIFADSSTPTVRFQSSTMQVNENVGSAVIVDLVIDNPGPGFILPYTVAGTATGSAVDHDLANGNVVVDTGAATASLVFNVIDDGLEEPDETIVIALGDPAGADLGAPATITITILANDPPTVTVLSPNGGETWPTGTDQTIAWESSNNSEDVDILFSADSGNNWTTLALAQPATGTYVWTVNALGTANARIRVTTGTLEDISDADFAIDAGSIDVTAPAAGLSLVPGEITTVTWTSTGYSGLVNIEYSIDGGTNFVPIAFAQTNDGSYDWSVPAERSSQALVRVRAHGAGPSGLSGIFTIEPAPGTSDIIYVKEGASGDGTSWSQPCGDLICAFAAATAGDEIWLAAGYYHGAITMPAGVQMYGGFFGNETARAQRLPQIRRPIIFLSTVDAGIHHDVILHIQSSSIVDGIALERHEIESIPDTPYIQPALSITGDNILLNDVVASDLTADFDGAAFVISSATNVVIRHSEFTSSRCAAGVGRILNSSVIFEESLFDDNVAEARDGASWGLAGIDMSDSTAEFSRCVLSNNRRGTTIAGNNSILRIVRSLVYNNDSTFAFGPPSTLSVGGTIELDGALLAYNRSGDGLIDSGSPLVVRNSVFYENDVSDRLFLTASNDTTVSHSILPERDGFQDGGGNIYGPAAFVDPLAFDFRPAPGAPQIDAGDANTAELYDLNFAPVLDDSGTPNSGLGTPTFLDIGPYEYQGSTLLRVTEPNANAVWTTGSEVVVAWTSVGIATVDIDVSADGGLSYASVAANLDADLGTHRFTMPALIGLEGVVRVTSSSGTPADTSDFWITFATATLYVDGSATGAMDGSSWENAYTTIEQLQGSLSAGATAKIAAGTYTATSSATTFLNLPAQTTIEGGYPQGGVGDRDPSTQATVLDGASLVDHVIQSTDALIDGLQVTGGGATVLDVGGGLSVGAGFTEVRNCRFFGNRAVRGSGIAVVGATAELLLKSSTIDGNEATQDAGYGGSSLPIGAAVYVDQASLAIVGSIFDSNIKGAFSAHDAVMVSVEQSSVLGHTGQETVQLKDSPVLLSRLTFEGNSQTLHHDGGALTMDRVLLASYDNGPFVAGGSVSITNSVFDGRDVVGPSLYVNGMDAAAEIINCTFYHGAASRVIDQGSSSTRDVNVTNSIIWGVAGAIFPDIAVLTNVSYSNTIGGVVSGSGNISSDPLFTDAANGHYSLQASSPALDAADGDSASTFDFAGDNRVDQASVTNTGIGGPPYVDMGAIERQ